MGIGYVLAVRPWFAESIMDQLRRQHEQVCVLGKLVKGTGRVLIG
jgi:phosphoribosylaminoimidazole (AIR) synthetase